MKKILMIISLVLICLFLYGKYIEINNLKVKEYTIYNENITDSFKELKIVHFSDILYKSKNNQDYLKDLVTKINEQNADIVIFSGDLFFKEEKYNNNDINFLKNILNTIEASLFKFAVIGDNDKLFLDKYKDILYESNFILLDNENKLVFYKDITPINVIGITNLENIDSLLESEISYNYTLAITHEPDNLEKLSNYKIDTILSGHSLGGIINIPYYGGIITSNGAKTYINDYYKLNNSEMYISNGIGNKKFDFRLFNTPSINIYRFDNTKKES